MTKNEINKIVEETIIKMGLQDCAENKIGNWHFRGISKGEKRRLSIGIEILTQPRVLFQDEVTSGLDSASSSKKNITRWMDCRLLHSSAK